MNRNYWVIKTLGSGGEWEDSLERLPIPNANLVVGMTSTINKVQLMNGKNAYFTPENTFIKSPLSFVWTADYDWVISKQITGYIQDGTFMKIVTHHDDIEFIGKFIEVNSEWIAGRVSPDDEDDFDVSAVFEQMDETAY